jgi:hypothetical protein
MEIRSEILKNTQDHIEEHGLSTSSEELFISFEILSTLHREFEAYLNNEKLIFRLNAMKRNKRLKEKRKLFAVWYIAKNQDKKMMKEMLYELSEMFFITTRSVQNDLFHETTEQN